MDFQVTGKCFFCDQPSRYLIGVSKYNWKKKIELTGETCREHVAQALVQTGSLSFGTSYWPAVGDMQEKLLYHSYHADRRQLSYVAGWDEYLKSKD